METAGGTVQADVVVRATEAWTPTLPGLRRAIVPVYSLMVATEPLGDAFWAEAGLSDRTTFADHRHMIIYGQRTADGRIAFGGRGAPYHFGSSIESSFDAEPGVHACSARPSPSCSRRWTTPASPTPGVARSGSRGTGIRRSDSTAGPGLAWAGGYVGDGVSTTNLAGRTLADLITGSDTDLVHLPWVGHQSPAWEPEPLRWLGVNAGLWTMKLADRSEVKQRQAQPAGRSHGEAARPVAAQLPSPSRTAVGVGVGSASVPR